MSSHLDHSSWDCPFIRPLKCSLPWYVCCAFFKTMIVFSLYQDKYLCSHLIISVVAISIFRRLIWLFVWHEIYIIKIYGCYRIWSKQPSPPLVKTQNDFAWFLIMNLPYLLCWCQFPEALPHWLQITQGVFW